MTLQLTYKEATINDFEDLFLIKCDKANVQWGGFVNIPNRQSFYEWYIRQLNSSLRSIYLVYEQSKPCAFFYLDKVNERTFIFWSLI